MKPNQIISVLIGLFCILGVTLLGGCCTSSLPINIPSKGEIISRTGSSTIGLVHKGLLTDRTQVYCTGVWVSERVILTANHCIEGLHSILQSEKLITSSELEITLKISEVVADYIVSNEVMGLGETPSGIHRAKVLALDAKHDIALLEAIGVKESLPHHMVVRLAKVEPKVGETVHTIGHVKGLYWSYVEGIVSNYRKDLRALGIDKSGPFMQVSMPVYYGNSGGGIFNKDGELVGIVNFLAPAPITSFMTTLGTIHNFLEEEEIK